MTTTNDSERRIETRFGPIDRDAASELHFPLGLPGFEQVDRFLLAEIPGCSGPLRLLRGLAGEPVELIVTPADNLPTAPAAADLEAARESLEIPAADLLVLCVVTLPPRGSGRSAQVNLRAPIFVDVVRRVAVQMVLSNRRYPFRAALQAA